MPSRATALALIVACLCVLGGLFDVAPRRLSIEAATPVLPEGTQRDATLTVAVTAAGGAALARAEVRVFVTRGDQLFAAGRARTGADGQVTLSELPRGAAWVLAVADGHARGSTRVVLSREARNVAIALGAASHLGVTVVDEQRRAIEDATVIVTAGDPLPYGALSDARGQAGFERLPAGPWSLKASARGYESSSRTGVRGDVEIELRRLSSLEVRVIAPGGTPVAEAEVWIAGSGLWPARRTTTDAQGRARIAALLPGRYDLRAQRGDLVSATLFGHEVLRGADSAITLQLEQGRQVTAVVAESDDPSPIVIPDADVTLAEDGISSFPLRGRTGADGSVVLGPLPPGPASLVAFAEDFVPSPAVAVPDPLTGPVRVVLLKGGTLRGDVVDANGRAIDGASIEVVGTDVKGFPTAETPLSIAYRERHFDWSLSGPAPLIPAGELGVMPGPVPPIPGPNDPLPAAQLGAAGGDVTREVAPWVTRGDGTFSAHPVTPGRVRAIVRHPSYVEGVSDAVDLGPGGEAHVKVVLLAGGALEGRVVDGAGRPVSDARVQLVAQHGTLERSTTTASDGRFAFAAVPADVMVSVSRPEEPGEVAVRRRVEVAEGQRTEIEIELPAPRDAASIAVRDDDRAPVALAQVSVLSLDPATPLRRTQFTSAEGAVEVPGAQGLPVRVLVEAPGYAPLAASYEALAAQVELVLRRGVLVQGHVTELSGRRPLAGVSITLLAEGRRSIALSNDEGLYEFRDVPPGSITLSFAHPSRAAADRALQVERPTRADRPFEVEPVDLAEAGEVEGTVVDERGRPVSGARVGVGSVPAYLPAGALPPGAAQTDRNGGFRLLGAPVGSVHLEAYSASAGRGATEVRVDAGRPTREVRIVLDPSGIDDEPAAVASVAVTLGERGTDEALEVVVVQVAAASEAERAGIRPGDVVVAIDGVVPLSMADARARLSGPSGADVIVQIDRGQGSLSLRVAREVVRR